MSGKYTTKTELFYGSWMEQTVNLRVHPVDSITISNDHRVVDWQNPPGESPANFFVQTHSQNHNKASADLIDGSSPANMDSPQYTDWVQIDTSKGTAIYYQDTLPCSYYFQFQYQYHCQRFAVCLILICLQVAYD